MVASSWSGCRVYDDSPTGYQELSFQGEYKNGQIRSRGKYIDGTALKDGKWFYYYENGQIKSEGNYFDGESTH